MPCVHRAACSREEWPSPFTASDNRDKAFVIALLTCITLTAMGVIPGASKMWYNPRIIWRPLNGIGVTAAIGYPTRCLLPLGLELWTK